MRHFLLKLYVGDLQWFQGFQARSLNLLVPLVSLKGWRYRSCSNSPLRAGMVLPYWSRRASHHSVWHQQCSIWCRCHCSCWASWCFTRWSWGSHTKLASTKSWFTTISSRVHLAAQELHTWVWCCSHSGRRGAVRVYKDNLVSHVACSEQVVLTYHVIGDTSKPGVGLESVMEKLHLLHM